MEIAGKSYRWLAKPDGTYVRLYNNVSFTPPTNDDVHPRMQLYKSGSNAEALARIRMTDLQTVVLEMKAEAFPASLFQPCITATVLLYSGQNFG